MSAVQDMYNGGLISVKSTVGITKYFKVEVALHQGLALSSFLFAVLMDRLMNELR